MDTDYMDVPAKIASVEAELVELKAQLTTTASEAREVALRQQIAAKENQLTECYKLLPRDGIFSSPITSIFSFISISICFYNF